MTITKSTVASAVWEEIYDRLNSDVTSITATVRYTDGTYVHTIQKTSSSFTDTEKTQKSDYPCIVIEPIKLGEEEFTFGKKFRTGRILVEIFATAAQVADKFMDAIIESIETYRSSLRDLGMKDVKLMDTDDDQFFDRGGIKLHSRTIQFSFSYIYDSTRSY